ncbi:MAG: ABC transporter substrate-binding protein [Cyanobacteriota bacterium]|nr:ABC transporter substrate-binding protein [Cyanobacteriota bacterium]
MTSAATSHLSWSVRSGLLAWGPTALLLLSLTACQAAKPPGTLIVATKSRIESLDPAKASRIGEQQLLSAIGDPLYAIAADGRLEPRLATALPQLSPDGRLARIPLRRGVRFHDGTPFDAAAMVFSLNRFLAFGTLSYQLSDRVSAIRARDPHTLELELKRPFAPLPQLLSSIVLTPVSPTAYRTYAKKPLPERFVGTGPYKLTFFGGQQLRLTPFAGYWGPQPANRGLMLISYSNSTALFGALRSGEVDVLLSNSLELDHQRALHRLAAAGKLKESVGPPLEIGFLSLLTSEPPLQDPRLRQALAHSLDRRLIQERVSLGMRPPLRSLVPPVLPGADPTAWPAYDPIRARALLRQVGYCNGRTLHLPLTFRSDIPSDRLFALTWQAQLRRDLADCLTLEPSGMESTTAYSQLDKGAFTMILLDWMGDYPDAENYLTPMLGCSKAEGSRCLEGGSVLSGSFWTAPGLEAELLGSSEMAGPNRLALLQRVQRRAADGVPYLPLWVVTPVAWAQTRVSPPRFDGSGRLVLSALRAEGDQP